MYCDKTMYWLEYLRIGAVHTAFTSCTRSKTLELVKYMIMYPTNSKVFDRVHEVYAVWWGTPPPAPVVSGRVWSFFVCEYSALTLILFSCVFGFFLSTFCIGIHASLLGVHAGTRVLKS
jgi:hypothetical protein